MLFKNLGFDKQYRDLIFIRNYSTCTCMYITTCIAVFTSSIILFSSSWSIHGYSPPLSQRGQPTPIPSPRPVSRPGPREDRELPRPHSGPPCTPRGNGRGSFHCHTQGILWVCRDSIVCTCSMYAVQYFTHVQNMYM